MTTTQELMDRVVIEINVIERDIKQAEYELRYMKMIQKELLAAEKVIGRLWPQTLRVQETPTK